MCRGFAKQMVTRGKEVGPGPGEPGWVAGLGLTPRLSPRGGAAGPGCFSDLTKWVLTLKTRKKKIT